MGEHPFDRLKRLVGLAATDPPTPPPAIPATSLPDREELADQLHKAWAYPADLSSYPLSKRWLLVADAAMTVLGVAEVKCPHCECIIRAPIAKPDV